MIDYQCNAMWIANTLHPRGQWDDIPCDEGVRFINGAVCKQASNKCKYNGIYFCLKCKALYTCQKFQ